MTRGGGCIESTGYVSAPSTDLFAKPCCRCRVVLLSPPVACRSLTAGQSHRSTRTLGTFNRAPPELLRLGRLSPACDVYAFGVMMWELYTGHVAFSGDKRAVL